MTLLDEKNISEFRHLVDEAQNIVVMCHKNPDGDSVGSSLALSRYLKSLGKEVTVIAPDAFPDFLQWLPGTQEIVRYDKYKEKSEMILKISDLIFCLDFNTLSRVGDELGAFIGDLKTKKILIDHHIGPDVPAVLTVSRQEMSSTSEMVFHILDNLGAYEDMDVKTATCIYCGMMTDTGAFTYNSASPEIYHIIARLIEKGINKDKIYRNVYWVSSVSRLRMWGHVLQNFHVSDDGHASYFTLSREIMKKFNYIKGDAEGLVNMPLQIKGMRLSISLREDTEKPNLIWVSLRSVDDFPCNKMAGEYFNGGGHHNASGGRLFCSLAEAEEIAKCAIRDFKY